MSKKLIVIMICFCIMLMGSAVFAYELLKPIDQAEDSYVGFHIKEGQSSRKIVENLAKEEIVRDKYTTFVLSTLMGNNFYANDYALSPSMSAYEVLQTLMDPQTNINEENGLVLTVIEGDNIDNIADNIARATDYSKQEILAKWNDEEYLNELIDQYWFISDEILEEDVIQPLEGMFSPSTFLFTKDESLETITTTMLDYTEHVYHEYKDVDYGDYTFYEVLTLASIIERETNNPDDMYKVSGVYHNRLKDDMKLQADITVLYAKQEHQEKVYYSDLEYDSPYNLYKNTGLTPGPIASPSLIAIDAAINPVETNYYYYYNTPDTGETIYSETFSKHQQVVSQYQNN